MQDKGHSIRKIQAATGVPRGTAFRIVKSFKELNYTKNSPNF